MCVYLCVPNDLMLAKEDTFFILPELGTYLAFVGPAVRSWLPSFSGICLVRFLRC